jgi:uncharacterized membrane protein
MYRILLAMCFLLAAMSCKNDKKTPELIPIPTAKATDTIQFQPDFVAKAAPKIPVLDSLATVSGIFIMSPEVCVLTDCKDVSKTYWVTDETGKLTKDFSQNKFEGAMTSNYVTVKGIITRTDKKIDYLKKADYQILVKEIVSIQPRTNKNDCTQKFDFWAMGTEPFWSMKIVAQGENLIEFVDLGDSKTYQFRYTPPLSNKDTLTYHALDVTNNTKAKIVICKGKCGDGMSNRDFKFNTMVYLGNKVFKGCATKE